MALDIVGCKSACDAADWNCKNKCQEDITRDYEMKQHEMKQQKETEESEYLNHETKDYRDLQKWWSAKRLQGNHFIFAFYEGDHYSHKDETNWSKPQKISQEELQRIYIKNPSFLDYCKVIGGYDYGKLIVPSLMYWTGNKPAIVNPEGACHMHDDYVPGRPSMINCLQCVRDSK